MKQTQAQAIEKERQRETARSINRQASELQAQPPQQGEASPLPCTPLGDAIRYGAKMENHADKLAEALRKLRQSIRHANYCKAPQAFQAFPCSCDADMLWRESEAALADWERMPHQRKLR